MPRWNFFTAPLFDRGLQSELRTVYVTYKIELVTCKEHISLYMQFKSWPRSGHVYFCITIKKYFI